MDEFRKELGEGEEKYFISAILYLPNFKEYPNDLQKAVTKSFLFFPTIAEIILIKSAETNSSSSR